MVPAAEGIATRLIYTIRLQHLLARVLGPCALTPGVRKSYLSL